MFLLIALTLLSLTAVVGSIAAIPRDGYHRVPINRDSQAVLRSQR